MIQKDCMLPVYMEKNPAMSKLVDYLQQPPDQLSWVLLFTEYSWSQGLAVFGGRLLFLPIWLQTLWLLKNFCWKHIGSDVNANTTGVASACHMHRCIGTSTEVSNVNRFFMVKKWFDCSFAELKWKCLALFVSEMFLIISGKLFEKKNSVNTENEMKQSIFCCF